MNVKHILNTSKLLNQRLAQSSSFKVNPLFYSTKAENIQKLYDQEVSKPADFSDYKIPKKHIYKKLYPWKESQHLAQHLHKSIIYNEDGLIAINKPYGVGIASSASIPKANMNETKFCIEDSLELLADLLKIEQLFILKSPEKYSSGVLLMSSSKEVAHNVKKSLLRAKPMCKPHMGHLVICQGYPRLPVMNERVGIKYLPDSEPELRFNVGKSCFKKKIVPALVHYNVLDVNKILGTSLFQVYSTTTKANFVRSYLSSKVACVLGDTLYGSRLNTLMGKPIKTNHDFGKDTQYLPPSIAEVLEIPSGKEGHMLLPTMIHRNKLILIDYLGKGKDLELCAPPLEYFEWTMDNLKLKVSKD